MRIMFLIDSLEGGGAERACLNIANELCKDNDVCVTAMFDADFPGYYVDPRIQIKELKIRKSASLLQKPRIYYQEISRLRRLKKEWHVDCCVSFLETANFLNVLSCVGEKTIASVRNYYSLSLTRERLWFQKLKAFFVGRRADKIISVSKAAAWDLVENFHTPEEKITVIYNMYDPDQVSFNRKEETYDRFEDLLQENPDSVRYISVGRMVPQKGQQHLIRAFRKLVEELPNAQLFLFGDGEEREYLEKVICVNGLEKNVHLMGFDPGIGSYLKQANVYVCTSLWEGFSNSILEAFVNEVPVISTDCRSGPRELLAPDTDCISEARGIEYAEYGILTPVCSGDQTLTVDPLEKEESALADAMIHMGKDRSLRERYAQKSRKRAEAFRRDVIVRQWKDIIK
ncbi:MAG: glycosyltransferase [Oscillospiraceae bacterium]|nr:glycosyltransferase [Oscillospiraceae bacterium]